MRGAGLSDFDPAGDLLLLSSQLRDDYRNWVLWCNFPVLPVSTGTGWKL